MTESVKSVHGVTIRLTDECWAHIAEEHAELSGLRQGVLDTVAHPSRVLAGNAGERMAVREYEPGKWLVAVYREVSSEDGFIITAFLTRRFRSLDRRTSLWP